MAAAVGGGAGAGGRAVLARERRGAMDRRLSPADDMKVLDAEQHVIDQLATDANGRFVGK